MDLIISINNDTTYTPYLSAVQLVGANWVHTQELKVNDPIANHRRVVGMVSGDIPFSGSITVHYSWVRPGPDGADVVLDFDVRDLGGQPLIGFHEQVQPGTALTRTSSQSSKLDGVDVVLLDIQE